MNKELCDCGKEAIWCYMPGFSAGDNPHFCDDCVPRGCECNFRSYKYDGLPEGEEGVDFKRLDGGGWTYLDGWTRIDEKGREYPCVEYMYDADGWDIE